MPKVAMLWDQSLVFYKTPIMDILATDALKDSEICLMSRTRPKLEQMEAFVGRVIEENGLPTRVGSTLDRRTASRTPTTLSS